MDNKKDNSKIIFYQFYSTTDLEYFQESLSRFFKESGHDREIEFRIWDCFEAPPGRDGDIYCYDAMILSYLVDEGYITRIPDIIDTSEIFPWVLNTTKRNHMNYGVPWALCFESIICRKEDWKEKYTDEDLRNQIAVPMKSNLPLYYYYAFANSQEGHHAKADNMSYSQKALDLVDRITELTGNRNKALEASFSSFKGIEEFSEGKVKYCYGPSEFIGYLPKGEYRINPLNYNTDRNDDISFIYVDLISIGKDVSGEKLLDCIDLMEICNSKEFQYDICMPHGKLSYMCPSNVKTFGMLSKLDNLYDRLYEICENEDNCAFRLGSDFYEKYPKLADTLMKAVK